MIDIIVKENLQSLIPGIVFILVCNCNVKRCRDRALSMPFHKPCLHTFWHAIPTSFYIVNVYYVLSLYFFDVNPRL